jgi:hypothetical protein
MRSPTPIGVSKVRSVCESWVPRQWPTTFAVVAWRLVHAVLGWRVDE